MVPEADAPKLLDQLRRAIRMRHYSIRTEHSYCEWVKRYCHFHNLRHPMEMGAPEINQFRSHLATDRNVAASTQNQACCAMRRKPNTFVHHISESSRFQKMVTMTFAEER
jgi:hypothetical protein